jgi:hypothetical protein
MGNYDRFSCKIIILDLKENLLDPTAWRKEELEEETLQDGEGERLYPLLDSTYHRQVR